MGEVVETDLAAWLLEQVAADEEVCGCHSVDCLDPQAATAWCTCGGRERWRVECDTKRRIIELHTGTHECIAWAHGETEYWGIYPALGDVCVTLRLLALPYAGRDGYREEWKVDR